MSVHLCHPRTSPYENYREGTQSATRLRNAHNVRFRSLADMRSAKGHVREVPKADIGKSLSAIRWSFRPGKTPNEGISEIYSRGGLRNPVIQK